MTMTMTMTMKKSGTYLPDDVEFLLTPIDMPSTTILDKEKLIQSKGAHYSSMITHEQKPSDQYKDIFYKSLSHYERLFSQDMVRLAYKILEDYQNESSITIVSLARAGTPIGVLLKRFLSGITDKEIKHYGVSIIRDVGLDINALNYIVENNKDTSIVFVDGWTGKGVIGNQLLKCVESYNLEKWTKVSGNLYVVLDISGTAHYGASHEDYLIPSAILNSTVSGLISRTVFNEEYLGKRDFHGFLFYEHLLEEDISLWFVDHILEIMKGIKVSVKVQYPYLNLINQKTIEKFQKELDLADINYIKPGIGEATRVMLRRVPDTLYVQSKEHFSVQHLLLLAEEKNVPVIEKSNLFYHAVAIIKQLD